MHMQARRRPRARLPLLTALAALAAAAPAQASFTPEAGSPYTAGVAPFGVVAADFDGSGRPDFAAINGNGSTVNVYLRQTAGGFAQDAGSPFGNVSGPNFGAAADFNGDGRPDLAIANFVSGTASIFIRQAGGGFVAEGAPPGGGLREGALAAGDFDGDGRPDVAIANWDNATVSVFLRTAGNTWTQEGTPVPVGPNPRYIATGDFNGDGRTDLAVTNNTGASVTVLLRGATGFTPEATIPVGASPAGVTAADFNGDGLADLAVANSGSASVTILLRQVGGGFAQEAGSPITVGGAPLGVHAADFNGDGRPDLAVASNSAGEVTVLLRQAAGGFAADAGSPMSVPRAYDLAAADFDGDGKPDLAVSQDAPGTVAVLLNTTPGAAPPPTPPTVLPPAPPVPGKSVVVKVISGTVKIKRPGKGYVVLKDPTNIPIGSIIDTRKGRVELTSAADTGGKKTQTAQFYDGIFQIKQAVPKKKPKKPQALVTDLVLRNAIARSQCAPLKRTRAAVVDKKKKKGPKSVLGKLWGSGKGKFQTTGKYSSATVRGTIWLTQDECDGTLTRVRRGIVSVRDFKRKKTLKVKAGHSYLARAVKRR
jgi:hypothetical protein